MIGGLRLLLRCPRMLSKTRLFSFPKIAAPEKAPLFRVREIFCYHWGGCAQYLIRDKSPNKHHVAFACDHPGTGTRCQLLVLAGVGFG
jgi:hypothetical protein